MLDMMNVNAIDNNITASLEHSAAVMYNSFRLCLTLIYSPYFANISTRSLLLRRIVIMTVLDGLAIDVQSATDFLDRANEGFDTIRTNTPNPSASDVDRINALRDKYNAVAFQRDRCRNFVLDVTHSYYSVNGAEPDVSLLRHGR